MTQAFFIITNTVMSHLKYILFKFAMIVLSEYRLDYELEDIGFKFR